MANLEALDLRWDAQQQSYTFGDGRTLHAPASPRYRRSVWEVEGTDGQVTVTLEHRDARHVDVSIRQRVAAGAAVPGATARLVAEDETDPVVELRWSSASTSGGAEQESVELRTVELAAGTRVRIEAKLEDRALSRSEAIIP